MKIVDQDVKWEAAFKSGRQIEQSLVENPVGILDDAAVYACMNSEGNSKLADLSDTHTLG